MRRIFTLLSLSALPVLAMAQTQRVVLLEHYTQASCGPCATFNPALNNLINANPGTVVSIKYQTSWPGVDPMNAHNPTEVATRVSYYGVNSVPRAVIDGVHYNGSPGNVSQTTLNNRAGVTSPYSVKVNHTFSPNFDSVTVRTVVLKTGNTPTGADIKLHTAVIERHINFPTAPGSNGEKHFESVMKKMLPNASGTTLGVMAIGDSTVSVQKWKLANVYDVSQIAAVSFVQNNTSKEVYQTGYAPPSFPLAIQLAALNGRVAKISGNSGTSSYTVDFSTMNPNNDTYRFELDKSQLPTGWDANFVINGTTYASTADIPTTPQATASITVNIIAGSDANKKGSVTLKANSIAFPQYSVSRRLTSFSDITTAFMSKHATGNANFITGFNAAGTSTVIITEEEFANIDPTNFDRAHINQLFVNTGDKYSSQLFTDTEVALMEQYLTSGGNLFVAGQDVGYSGFEEAGSASYKSFYSNYLGATYLSDGTDAGHAINPVQGEIVFGSLTPTTLNTASFTLYSDIMELNPTATNAVTVLRYDGGAANNVAAIRNNGSNWKVMFLGFRFEALSSSAFRNAVIDKSIHWFNGTLSSEEMDQQLARLMQSAYPNPASDVVSIPFTQVPAGSVLEVCDVLGRVVLSQNVPAGDNLMLVNTASLQAGTYFYRLQGSVNTAARKLIIAK